MKLRIKNIKAVEKKPTHLSPIFLIDRFKKGILLQKKKAEPREKILVPEGYPYPFKVKKKEEKKEKEEMEGIPIPTKFEVTSKPLKLEEKETLLDVDIRYPLIPKMPKKDEFVFSYAHIIWDKKRSELMYNVVQPKISQSDKNLIAEIKKKLEEMLDVDFSKLGEIQAKNILKTEIRRAMMGIDLGEEKKAILSYYIENDIIGLGKIQPMMNDPNIEDISCDGVKLPVYVYHRDPKLASMKTNIVFDDKDELNEFVVKIAQKSNKTITIASPLLDAALPDGSRIQATLGTDIARKGSNFTIRRFTEKPLTPTHMLKYNTLDSMQLAYLWLAIDNRQSILVSGGTATGKTCLLNALSLFIRPNMKIVSIEDTAELRLPSPHWVPHVARTPLSIKGRVGEVTLFDLLKSSLRQRPDYIIVGEVRGREAFVLFQQMATGHPSLATIHAATIPQLIDRLITPPISLPPTLIENINIIVFLTMSRLKGSYVRRTDNILEVIGVEKEKPITNKIFEWKPVTDTFETKEKSVVLKSISKRMGITEDSVKEEVVRRKKVLEWMFERGIFDYRRVAKVINLYYSDPERLMNLITEA